MLRHHEHAAAACRHSNQAQRHANNDHTKADRVTEPEMALRREVGEATEAAHKVHVGLLALLELP
jgi:hypothetical protein